MVQGEHAHGCAAQTTTKTIAQNGHLIMPEYELVQRRNQVDPEMTQGKSGMRSARCPTDCRSAAASAAQTAKKRTILRAKRSATAACSAAAVISSTCDGALHFPVYSAPNTSLEQAKRLGQERIDPVQKRADAIEE
jgi:hypothetical protein